MQLNNDFSKAFDQINALKTKNAPPATVTSTKQGTPVVGPKAEGIPTYDKKDSTVKTPSAKGNANEKFCTDNDSMIADWKKAAQTGKKIDFSKMPSSGNGKIEKVNYLLNTYSQGKEFNSSQKAQIATFFKEVTAKASLLNDPSKRHKILSIMNDGISAKGLTKEQMKMVADGDFTADAYLALVNKGEPIG